MKMANGITNGRIRKLDLSVEVGYSVTANDVLLRYRDGNYCFFSYGNSMEIRDGGKFTVKNITTDDFGRLQKDLAEAGIPRTVWKIYSDF